MVKKGFSPDEILDLDRAEFDVFICENMKMYDVRFLQAHPFFKTRRFTKYR